MSLYPASSQSWESRKRHEAELNMQLRLRLGYFLKFIGMEDHLTIPVADPKPKA